MMLVVQLSQAWLTAASPDGKPKVTVNIIQKKNIEISDSIDSTEFTYTFLRSNIFSSSSS